MLKKSLLTLLLLAVSYNAQAFCWMEASDMYGIPVEVLIVIAQNESSLNPKARNTSNKNGTYDIGLMQINSAWLPTLKKFGISEETLNDPCVNLKVGAWVLANNAKVFGWNWTAIGAYNVGCKNMPKDECEKKRNEYAWRIHKALNEYRKFPSATYVSLNEKDRQYRVQERAQAQTAEQGQPIAQNQTSEPKQAATKSQKQGEPAEYGSDEHVKLMAKLAPESIKPVAEKKEVKPQPPPVIRPPVVEPGRKTIQIVTLEDSNPPNVAGGAGQQETVLAEAQTKAAKQVIETGRGESMQDPKNFWPASDKQNTQPVAEYKSVPVPNYKKNKNMGAFLHYADQED
jgi:hypothetical protein